MNYFDATSKTFIGRIEKSNQIECTWFFVQVNKFKLYKFWDPQSLAIYSNCFELPSDWLLQEPIRGQLKTITL